jgi:hypothetical protein
MSALQPAEKPRIECLSETLSTNLNATTPLRSTGQSRLFSAGCVVCTQRLRSPQPAEIQPFEERT